MSAKKTDTTLNWFISIIVIVAMSLILIVFASTNIEKLSLQQRITDRNQALTTTAIVFLGLAVMLNAYYAAKRTQAMQKNAITAEKSLAIGIENTKLTQERLIAERFIGGIAQLGHDKVETRIGAIYALERIAQDFPQEHWTIMEILTAFIRENAAIQIERKVPKPEDFMTIDLGQQRERARRQQPADYSIPLESFKLRTDIQAALTVIGRRNFQQDRENQKLDLRNTDIRRVDLAGAKLQGVDLRGSDLSGSDLREIDLSGADLDGVKLIGSILFEANLFKASLRGANLSRANLNLANLYGVNLRSANLSGASLRAANLQAANLYKANLQQATLKAANLSGAKLFLANLQGAKLGKTNLQLAGLTAANLQGANLNGANLQGANLNAAKLQQTDIYFANLSEASLTEADLQQANLMGANLCKAILDEADLSWANLMGANLAGAHLCDVKLTGTILTGAKNLELEQINMTWGDRTTRLPDYIEIPESWRQSV
ncbi:pentapeptide repeat-containing protein [Anabaena cylindrica FACHB-243]|uniref:Pentapeptide repeat protein n=1 Tax=Anabaena cylindrica (strain ATCC 27899 / PCC 7122) TaxID=272123 RepID=K9ZAL8_ANACC|nr:MULTISPECIES: pentapeptide repeat-containing protein [Anabaena]AFZ55652.1 pentapeptide repeat protein [Anabaena cylindrica PCC 7122]MBD2420409.1 pentapeptide repeat-containing protein [Anabaena cylindrica FACHB-243]MBY5281746.1 pentapeptide repeat-containing protein [Anabaena sp. CCAP 1446/1C]MBY5310084.1 pentapeptide repeat-containing protein [Anabaena sp. CCAP 1446/1C]MCM2406965.1 pentapeptide repeat-containing protein [Anabaena sp. CCAP 1446/1C]